MRLRDKLTAKQQRFVDAYTGNGVDAARKAGYVGSDDSLAASASRLLRSVKVSAAIAARHANESAPLIADRQERQRFWTASMRGSDNTLSDRLRASELLGKSEADFKEVLDHRSGDGSMSPKDAGAVVLAKLKLKHGRKATV